MPSTCPACGQKISPSSSWCPWCGERIYGTIPWKPILIIGGIVLVFVVLLIVLIATGNG